MHRLKTFFCAAPFFIMLFLLQSATLTAVDLGVSKTKTTAWLTANTNGNEGGSMIEISIIIGGSTFAAKLYDNAAARALLSQFPLTLKMHELNGNEKYANLSIKLPAASERMKNIRAGDLMLFGTDCLVLFYESFASTYSYTKLGCIENATGLAAALGPAGAEITFRKD